MPKDGTVHELTSNVGAARAGGGGWGDEGGHQDLEALSTLSRPGLPEAQTQSEIKGCRPRLHPADPWAPGCAGGRGWG